MATITKNLGIVSPVPKGVWDANTVYQKLNIVSYNGSSYMAKQSSKAIEPGKSNNWELYWMFMVDINAAKPYIVQASTATDVDGHIIPTITYSQLNDIKSQVETNSSIIMLAYNGVNGSSFMTLSVVSGILYGLFDETHIWTAKTTEQSTVNCSLTDLATMEALNTLKSSLATVYTYRGSVENYESLPMFDTDENIGYTYNVTSETDIDGKIYPAGTNFAWTGTYWDALGGNLDLSAYATTEDVAEAIADLNIQNGNGTNSLVQKDANNSNTASGNGSVTLGEGNTNSGQRSIVCGNNNQNEQDDCVMFGEHLSNSNALGAKNKLIAGKYNNVKNNTLVEVGNGSQNSRFNAFEVYADGSVRAGKQTAESDNELTLTTNKYVRLHNVLRVIVTEMAQDPVYGVIVPKLTSDNFGALYYGAGQGNNVTFLSFNTSRIYIINTELIGGGDVQYRKIVGFKDNFKITYTRNESTLEVTLSVSKMTDYNELKEVKTYVITSSSSADLFTPNDVSTATLQEAAAAYRAGRPVVLYRTYGSSYCQAFSVSGSSDNPILMFSASNNEVLAVSVSGITEFSATWARLNFAENAYPFMYVSTTGTGMVADNGDIVYVPLRSDNLNISSANYAMQSGRQCFIQWTINNRKVYLPVTLETGINGETDTATGYKWNVVLSNNNNTYLLTYELSVATPSKVVCITDNKKTYRHEITISGLWGIADNKATFCIDNKKSSAYNSITTLMNEYQTGQAACLMNRLHTTESGSTNSFFNGMVKYNSSFMIFYGCDNGSNVTHTILSSSIGTATISDSVTELKN